MHVNCARWLVEPNLNCSSWTMHAYLVDGQEGVGVPTCFAGSCSRVTTNVWYATLYIIIWRSKSKQVKLAGKNVIISTRTVLTAVYDDVSETFTRVSRMRLSFSVEICIKSSASWLTSIARGQHVYRISTHSSLAHVFAMLQYHH